MRIVISGIGMVSSVGYDVNTACASLRAGISRPSELHYYQALDAENEVVPLIGHSASFLSGGFYLLGRWISLSIASLLDMLRYAELSEGTGSEFWQRTGVIGVIPIINERFECPESPEPEFFKAEYLQKVIDSAELPILPEKLWIINAGHAGVMVAMKKASESIESGELDRVIVMAVDSLIEPMSLNWLESSGRLHSPDMSEAMIAGEASACFLLESDVCVKSKGRKAEVEMKALSLDIEENSYDSGEQIEGKALARVMTQCLSNSKVQLPFLGDLVTDMNGEPWRAYQLGAARMHLGTSVISDGLSISIPAECIGDAGTASGAISVCVAIRSISRKYANNNTVLVISSSEDGSVGAVSFVPYSSFV